MANLRNRIAILDDITKNRLDPAKAHSALQKDGHLKLMTDLATEQLSPTRVVIQQENKVEELFDRIEYVEAPVTVEETVEAPVTKQRKNKKTTK